MIPKLIKRHKWIIILTIFISVYFIYNFVMQEAKLQNLSQSIYDKKISINELEFEIASLNDDLNNAKSNKNIERLAREKLKMVLEDEVLYIIEER